MSQPLPPTLLDRLMVAFRALVRAEFPQWVYLGRREYIVQATDGVTVDARPVEAAAGLPDLVGVPLWPGILGEQVTPKVGSAVLVEFIGADPSRPIVTGGDPSQYPTLAKLAGGGNGVARKTDAVSLGAWSVTIGGGAVTSVIKDGVALTVVPTTQTGSITGGSTKVTCG